MKIFTLFSFLCILLPATISANCLEFIHQITGDHHERPTHLVTDKDDNIIVAGLFKGSARIGSHNLEGGGDNDIFLIKFDPEGQILWTTTIETGGPDFGWTKYVRALKVDKNGDIFILGLFREHVIHDSDTLQGTNAINHFLMKLDANGQMMWGKALHSALDNHWGALEVDEGGNAYLSVNYTDTLKFGHLSFPPADSSNFTLLKISPAGNLLWHRNLFSASKPYNFGYIRFAGIDKYIVTGSFSQGAILHLKDTTILTPGNSPGGIYFLEFDSSGNFSRGVFGNSDSPFDWVQFVIKGIDDYYYAAGLMMSTLTIGQFTVSAANPGSWLEQDIFFLKMDTAGEVIWLKNFGSDRRPTGLSDMVLNNENNIFLFGNFQHNIHIDNLNYESKEIDLYIAKFSPHGILIDVFITEATVPFFSSMYSGGLALNSKEEILISASFSWETYIRDTLVKNTQLQDGLVMKLCGLTTSIGKQMNNDLQLDIFPNPANSVVNIKNRTDARVNRLEVVNINGQLVLQDHEPRETLDISSLPKGFYIINIHTDKGVVRKKIIKQL